jgi:tetratricopeptide (TPR) repeat protein
VHLAVKTLALAVALGVPVVAAKTPRRGARVERRAPPVEPHVVGVQREHILDLPTNTTHPAVVRRLPGALGFEIELAVPPAQVATALDAIAPPWHVDVRPLEHGVRIRIAHPQPGVTFASAERDGELRIAFGAADEQTRLRAFAATIQMALPEPDDLGAELEAWQDAEDAVRKGDMPEAKRRWERLAAVPRLADVAGLRIAELFVVTGHINEAIAQLRGVSSRHPRSAGAALARIDILHLEALTGLGTPTTAQLDIATAVLERPTIAAFAKVRAAMVLRDLGDAQAALARMPDPATLSPTWREPAEALRQDLVALTLVGPMLGGDLRSTAIHWALWSDRRGRLADEQTLTDMVAEAHEKLGLFDVALPLLQERLRTAPVGAVEADLVGRVAHAYRMTSDVARASFAVEFQIETHPAAPGVVDELAALAVTRCERDGLVPTRTWLAAVRERAGTAALSRAIDAIDGELVLGWGTSAQIVHRFSNEIGGDMLPTGTHSMPTDATTTDAATKSRHAHALAVALVRVGRHAEAADKLRALAGRSADPAERDRLAYYLAVAEQALGHEDDAMTIFGHISTHGTTFGQLAIARLQERRLATAVAALGATTTETTP